MTSTSHGGKSSILVLGATGGTGRIVVRDALMHGHRVTALVRSPDKAKDLEGATIIQGDARDERALRAPHRRDQDGRLADDLRRRGIIG